MFGAAYKIHTRAQTKTNPAAKMCDAYSIEMKMPFISPAATTAERKTKKIYDSVANK